MQWLNWCHRVISSLYLFSTWQSALTCPSSACNTQWLLVAPQVPCLGGFSDCLSVLCSLTYCTFVLQEH